MLLLVAVSIFSLQIQAQYVITGRVTDAKSGDPVPFANVALKGKSIGTTTNFEGNYTLKTKILADSMLATSVGYLPRVKKISKDVTNQVVNFQLADGDLKLAEVVVKRGENPAWRILRGVVENKEKNDRKRLSAYEYDSYSKMELDLNDISQKMREKKVMRKIGDVIDKMEKLAGEDGKPVIPAFISETVSKFYYRESPLRKKEHILKTNVTGVAVNKMDLITQLLGGNMFQNYNFYDNFVPFLGKDFPSPMANDWKSQYNYYLADSMQLDKYWCYLIEFDPKRKLDLSFTGSMWIDSKTFALLQIDATIGKEANINFIDKIKISQELEQTSDSAWLPAKTRFLVGLAKLSEGTTGMLVKQYVANKNFVVDKPRDLSFFDVPVEVAEDAKDKNPEYWKQARPDSLNREDRLAMAMVDTIRNIPIVKTYVEIAEVLTSGYKTFNKFDVGPYVMSFGVNAYEGFRSHIGFRSNASFSKEWVIRGFLGFGTKDLTVKYGGELDYILNRKRWTMVGIKHSYDLERLGLASDQIGENKLFLAFTRFGNFRGGYFQHETEAFFKTEALRNWTFTTGLNHRTFQPLGNPFLDFEYLTNPSLGDASPRSSIYEDTYAYFEARFAKNENYVMDGNEKITLNTRRIPVITFRYTKGISIAGGQFDYDKFTLKFYQTFRLGVIGRSAYTLKFGYSPSTLPAPLLFPSVGNQTFFFNREAFNTMSYHEFVSDKFVSLQYLHQFEGFLFNRLPLIKKLKWRLVGLANVLYGSERIENQDLVPKLDSQGMRTTHLSALNPNIPFVEVGYGIDNIFKIFRVQALHRITYTDNPFVKNFSVKVSLHFSF